MRSELLQLPEVVYLRKSLNFGRRRGGLGEQLVGRRMRLENLAGAELRDRP